MTPIESGWFEVDPREATRLNVRLFLPSTAANLALTAVAVAAVVFAALALVMQRPAGYSFAVAIGGATLGYLVSLGLFLVRSRMVPRHRANRGVLGRRRLELQPDRLTGETEGGMRSDVPWGQFVRRVDFEDGLALFVSRYQFVWVPRGAFDPADWERARSLMASRIPLQGSGSAGRGPDRNLSGR